MTMQRVFLSVAACVHKSHRRARADQDLFLVRPQWQEIGLSRARGDADNSKTSSIPVHDDTAGVVVVCKLVPDGAERLEADVECSQVCPSTSQTSSIQ